MDKKNITFFDLAGSDYPGGCEKYFSILANHFSHKDRVYFFQSRQYTIFLKYLYAILCMRKPTNINYVKRNIGNGNTVDLSFLAILPFSKEYKRIKTILNTSDIIYSKNEFQELMLLFYFLGKNNFSQKVIIGVHSAIFVPDFLKGIWKIIHDAQYKSIFYRYFLQHSKKIHVLNSDYIDLISKEYRIPKEKIVKITNFINWKTTIHNTQNKKFTILWIGRLTLQKGIDRLEKIIHTLSNESFFENINILIAGEGDQEPKIEKLSMMYNNVNYLGFVENVEELYEKTDLVIATSHFEMFPYSLLESQSFGIPTICSNILGSRDIIDSDEVGHSAQNDKDYIIYIKKYYELWKTSKKDYKAMKKIVYMTTNNKFNKNKIMKEIEALLYA